MIINPFSFAAPGGSGYYDEVIADSPLAYWRVGESSGTTATDEIGSYNGIYSGTYTLGETGAISGNLAVGFSGVAGYMTASPQAAIAGLTAVTLECWMYRASSGQQVTMGHQTTTTRRFAISWATDNNVYMIAENGNFSYEYAAANVTGWQHFALVFDGSLGVEDRIRCYRNGILQTSTRVNTTPTSLGTSAQLGDMILGTPATGNHSTGRIDEVAIYGSALSTARVLAHYDAA